MFKNQKKHNETPEELRERIKATVRCLRERSEEYLAMRDTTPYEWFFGENFARRSRLKAIANAYRESALFIETLVPKEKV